MVKILLISILKIISSILIIKFDSKFFKYLFVNYFIISILFSLTNLEKNIYLF
jgi:hypothetical protein